MSSAEASRSNQIQTAKEQEIAEGNETKTNPSSPATGHTKGEQPKTEKTKAEEETVDQPTDGAPVPSKSAEGQRASNQSADGAQVAKTSTIVVVGGSGKSGDKSLEVWHPRQTDALPSLSPNVAAFGKIPAAPKNIVGNHSTMPSKSTSNIKHPNQMPLVKMSTVTMASRQRAPSSRLYYNNYVENRRPRKVITWDQATNARPPLRIDMDGPGPCSYSPRNKPLYETNAPAWSFGRKTFVEKSGGSRTSWEKTWFQAENVWTQKADFYSDRKWPDPSTHPQKPTVGQRSVSLRTAPHHTFGYKRPLLDDKEAAEEPPPNIYDIDRADVIRLPKSPAYSHSHRWGGTCLWPFTEVTPGPGTYRPERSFLRIKTHYPSFSIRGIRREKTQDLGPFAAF